MTSVHLSKIKPVSFRFDPAKGYRSSCPCSMTRENYGGYQTVRCNNTPTSTTEIMVSLKYDGKALKCVYHKLRLPLRKRTLNKDGTFYPHYVSSPCFIALHSPVCSPPLMRVRAVYCLFLIPLSVPDSFQSLRLFFFLFIEDHSL